MPGGTSGGTASEGGARLGLASAFHVTIDQDGLGMWTSCSGLSAKYQVETYEEGGQNGFVHKLPGRLTFDNVKLTRAVDEQSWAVAKYFSTSVAETGAPTRRTALIRLFDSNSEQVAAWELVDVVPVSWTGPQLGAGKSEVGTEELELAHNGIHVELG